MTGLHQRLDIITTGDVCKCFLDAASHDQKLKIAIAERENLRNLINTRREVKGGNRSELGAGIPGLVSKPSAIVAVGWKAQRRKTLVLLYPGPTYQTESGKVSGAGVHEAAVSYPLEKIKAVYTMAVFGEFW